MQWYALIDEQTKEPLSYLTDDTKDFPELQQAAPKKGWQLVAIAKPPEIGEVFDKDTLEVVSVPLVDPLADLKALPSAEWKLSDVADWLKAKG